MPYPLHTSRRQLAAILLSATALLSGGDAAARRHEAASASVSGDFRYYLLSLSWSPAFCLESPGGSECDGVRRFGFIAHGLWPQNEYGSPRYCPTRSRVPENVAAAMADLMPSRDLVEHEWRAHGSCSGLAPARYFSLLRRATENLHIPPAFTAPRIALSTTPPAIADEFMRANPGLPRQAIVVTCSRQVVPRLREVRVCLDRELAPRDCSRASMRGGCRAQSVIVPPLR